MNRLLLFLCALAPAAPAAELVERDLRVAVGSRPLDFDFDFTGRATSASGSDAFDAALGIEGGGRWSFARPGDAFGLVVGADVLIDGWSYGGSDGLATTWARASAGAGWAVNDHATVVVEAGLQYGLSALSLPASSTSPEFSASGTATGYDLRIDGNWMFDRRFGVAVFAGWLIASHDLTGDADVTIDQNGWFAGLGAVWRFTDAPARLE